VSCAPVLQQVYHKTHCVLKVPLLQKAAEVTTEPLYTGVNRSETRRRAKQGRSQRAATTQATKVSATATAARDNAGVSCRENGIAALVLAPKAKAHARLHATRSNASASVSDTAVFAARRKVPPLNSGATAPIAADASSPTARDTSSVQSIVAASHAYMWKLVSHRRRLTVRRKRVIDRAFR
jgi:hypothetical protein